MDSLSYKTISLKFTKKSSTDSIINKLINHIDSLPVRKLKLEVESLKNILNKEFTHRNTQSYKHIDEILVKEFSESIINLKEKLKFILIQFPKFFINRARKKLKL